MNEETRDSIVTRCALGMSQKEVARIHDVSQQLVSRIWRRHIGAEAGQHGGDRKGKQHQKQTQRAIKRAAKRRAKKDGNRDQAGNPRVHLQIVRTRDRGAGKKGG